MELFILFCPLDGAGAWEPGGAACFALGTGTALDKIRLPRMVPHFVYGAPPNIDFVKPEKIFLLQKTQITGILNKDKKMWNPA